MLPHVSDTADGKSKEAAEFLGTAEFSLAGIFPSFHPSHIAYKHLSHLHPCPPHRLPLDRSTLPPNLLASFDLTELTPSDDERLLLRSPTLQELQALEEARRRCSGFTLVMAKAD